MRHVALLIWVGCGVVTLGCGGTDSPDPNNGNAAGSAGSRSSAGAASRGTDPIGQSGTTNAALSNPCPNGTELCACYGNDTCNAGLVCASHLCVRLPGAPSTGGAAGSLAAPPTSSSTSATALGTAGAAAAIPATGGTQAIPNLSVGGIGTSSEKGGAYQGPSNAAGAGGNGPLTIAIGTGGWRVMGTGVGASSYGGQGTSRTAVSSAMHCGDGVIDASETCDDGNTESGDGCLGNCSRLEQGWQCRQAGLRCVPICGDGLLTGTERCDDGNARSGDGCSSVCRLEPGADCSDPGHACTLAICGNGKAEIGESCDRGTDNGLFWGDGSGCSKTCTKEPKCRDGANSRACDIVCGDGSLGEGEGCDDGNQADGDGCSRDCKIEAGFACENTEGMGSEPCPSSAGECLVLPIVFRDFDSQKESTGHPDFFYMGANPSGGQQTLCVPNASGRTQGLSGTCPGNDSTAPCIGLVKETLGDGGKPQANTGRANGLTCACQFTDWDKTGLLDTNPDSSTCESGSSGPIRLLQVPQMKVIQSAESFKQWYADSDKSTRFVEELALPWVAAQSRYQFNSSGGRTTVDDIHDIFCAQNPGCTLDPSTPMATSLSSGFFPDVMEHSTRTKTCNLMPYWTAPKSCIGPQRDLRANGTQVDNVEGIKRNFYFTSELRYIFRFSGGGETVEFVGDDDVWIFINGRLVLDMGGTHERLRGTVVLSASGSTAELSVLNSVNGWFAPVGSPQKVDASVLNLQVGKSYELAVFHAERSPTESNYQLSLSGFRTTRSVCLPQCGDGVVTAGEECDAGDHNMPASQDYGGCTTDCTLGPYCGDGTVNGPELCDRGTQNGAPYGNKGGCTNACQPAHYCGDGLIDSAVGEECDGGSLCSASCRMLVQGL